MYPLQRFVHSDRARMIEQTLTPGRLGTRILEFLKRTVSAMSTPEFPEKGILWRGWNDETLSIINEKNRPVLLVVADPNPLVWPFLREILKEMPNNTKLRNLLHES